jgi:hypothetical protein
LREVVDERARWLSRQRAIIESGPAEFDYTSGYYAVFFYDPDGLKLELVHRPTYWEWLLDAVGRIREAIASRPGGSRGPTG